MKTALYRLIQCTWGLPQTLLGLIVFLAHRKGRHFSYHGAIVTEWQGQSSVSLGQFLFVTAEPFFLGKLPPYPRREKQRSYFSFFTEKWANALGEKVTGCRSMEQLVID